MDNKMQVISSVAAKVAGGGAAASVGSAAVAHVQVIWGYTVDQWTVICGIGGLCVAVLGLIVSATLKVLDHLDQKRHRRKLLEISIESLKHDTKKSQQQY